MSYYKLTPQLTAFMSMPKPDFSAVVAYSGMTMECQMAAKEEANSEGGSNRGSRLLFRMERERSGTLTVLGRILSPSG